MITTKRVVKAGRRELSKAAIALRAAAGAAAMHQCPACKRSVVRFYTYGIRNWGCPHCNASPRERFVNLCLETDLLTLRKGVRILHMAPKETSLISLFSTRCTVVFGDLFPNQYPNANVIRVDLMDMSALDRFDIFYASHVMEHVPDDRQVFSNVYDRLVPGGEAWIMVPLHDAPTIDGTPDMTAKERERQFGQWDHVRQYGSDIADRMRDAGFETSIIDIECFSPSDIACYGLSSNDKIFVGRRC